MGFIDSIAKKIFGKDEDYLEFSISETSDGCLGEEIIASIKKLFKKEEPC